MEGNGRERYNDRGRGRGRGDRRGGGRRGGRWLGNREPPLGFRGDGDRIYNRPQNDMYAIMLSYYNFFVKCLPGGYPYIHGLITHCICVTNVGTWAAAVGVPWGHLASSSCMDLFLGTFQL